MILAAQAANNIMVLPGFDNLWFLKEYYYTLFVIIILLNTEQLLFPVSEESKGYFTNQQEQLTLRQGWIAFLGFVSVLDFTK